MNRITSCANKIRRRTNIRRRTIIKRMLRDTFPRIFLDQYSQCKTDKVFALRFCGDMVMHLYPHSKQQDEYIHALLIGHNETSNEGIMLTNVALLEILGLLKKETNGKCSLGPNVTKRLVFMYGDALFVSLYGIGTLYNKIFRNIMQLRNENYDKTLLDTQEDTQQQIFIQEGHFHQIMHHLGRGCTGEFPATKKTLLRPILADEQKLFTFFPFHC